jgi:hypothetical protein
VLPVVVLPVAVVVLPVPVVLPVEDVLPLPMWPPFELSSRPVTSILWPA